MTPWSGQAYDAQQIPHSGWGRRLMDSLSLRGDEVVLDVGCGTGRDLAALLPRLPQGRVTALDASASMLDRLRERVGTDPRVNVVQADLNEALPLVAASFDVVMSVAALHWLRDHDRVWDRLAALLVPGGQLVVECGGAGNIARVIRAVEQVAGPDAVPRWTFAGADLTARRLRAAGMVDVTVAERDAPAVFPDQARLCGYLHTLALHNLPPAALREVAARLDDASVDYVRLEVRARAAG